MIEKIADVVVERDWPGVGGETPESLSLDPFAGGTYNDKPIYTVGQAAVNLNRTGYNWYLDNYGELSDGVLNFGFWANYEELVNSYYVNATSTIAFTEAFDEEAFSILNAGQRELVREGIALWDDLVAISFQETKSFNADIVVGNTDTGGAQAYAYLPFGTIYDAAYLPDGFEEIGRLSGDVWIDGFVSSNFFPLDDSFYAKTTMVHELGHSLGLSHPGDYNALDDDDGDGVPDPITYANDAAYAQDTLQYSIMSYFDAYETGAQHIDWANMRFGYAATPLVHDIAAIQRIYGVDLTTRTDSTVYGFNSTANRAEFDFARNKAPIVAIYDAGGEDTLDFSGWDTPSLIDLNEGAFSSGGGIEAFLSLEEVNANRAELGLAPRSQAVYDLYMDIAADLGLTTGLYKDNIAIAYGTVIENAVGGGGNDRLIGNSANNNLAGGAGRDVFELHNAGVTGADVIADWGRADMLAVDNSLRDGNGDGIITWSGSTLRIDPSDGDTARLIGASNSAGLRLMGEVDGIFYYADARLAPTAGAGQVVHVSDFGNDVLTGSTSGKVTDIFFFDTANPIAGMGADNISFSARDLVVTTTALADGNGDGIIRFGSDGTLDLSGTGGTVAIAGAGAIEFDGMIEENGVRYYVYSALKSSVGLGDIDF
ncbi:M10 family metallopeptidase C-terminal domain-containing protein [Sphingomonas sp. IW22]|uniref:M10 family metallopeptidase C-terminal domain-containing protein n=1 Tax=Sphingomonas sp. IW22 TaxID=3242489 RepID=UPI00352159EC